MDDGEHQKKVLPDKSRWSLLIDDILGPERSSPVLQENFQSLQIGVDELSKNLLRLSQYRHHLNRRLEKIKMETEELQRLSLNKSGSEKKLLDQKITFLQEEGYGLQIELESIENNLKHIRTHQREHDL